MEVRWMSGWTNIRYFYSHVITKWKNLFNNF